MIGDKIYKPIDTQEKCDEYSALAEWCNNNNALMEDKGEYYECVAIPLPSAEELVQREIAELKANLSATDYKAIKYAEGEISVADYADIKAQRASWRARINELEGELE